MILIKKTAKSGANASKNQIFTGTTKVQVFRGLQGRWCQYEFYTGTVLKWCQEAVPLQKRTGTVLLQPLRHGG